ncbi:peptidase inhibitor family I36 protein [Streptomyces sp. NPDC087440]|uniref:peptidase inhibitor family I36 protein n=1 Tax=Streptomyces sp. NPDC087440 TaxID=3365790 RepID=UPI003805BA25
MTGTRSHLAALAAAAGLLVGGAGSAAADDPPSPAPPGAHLLADAYENKACPQGWMCVFDSTQARGFGYALLPGAQVRDTINLKASNHWTLKAETIDSFVNNTALRYCLFDKVQYQGARVVVEPFTSGDNTGGLVQSIRVCS